MQATDSAVRREITVNATPERAFAVFTERFDTLVAAQPLTSARPSCDAGRHRAAGRRPLVRARRRRQRVRLGRGARLRAAAPARAELADRRHLGQETDPERYSEIEVTFTPEGDATRVTLVHGHLERHTAAAALREGVGGEGAGTACWRPTPRRCAG